MLIAGSCHCGNISFTLAQPDEAAEMAARACTCSFCTKHGGVWTSAPAGSLEVKVRDRSLVSAYRFGTGTADFQVCAACGAVPVVTSRIEDRLYAVVSVNALDGVDRSLFRQVAATFDGEDEAARLARRQRNWIAAVRFVDG